MIDFNGTWLPQIRGYCELVRDNESLRRAWVEHDTSITSVGDFNELYEQVFDDLDSEAIERRLLDLLPGDRSLCSALSAFLVALKSVDAARERAPTLRDPAALISSPPWHALQLAAAEVLRVGERNAS